MPSLPTVLSSSGNPEMGEYSSDSFDLIFRNFSLRQVATLLDSLLWVAVGKHMHYFRKQTRPEQRRMISL
jgi:hypothetical protein